MWWKTISGAFLNPSSGLSVEGAMALYSYLEASTVSALTLKKGGHLLVSAQKPFGRNFLWEEAWLSKFLDYLHLISDTLEGSREKALEGQVGGAAFSNHS